MGTVHSLGNSWLTIIDHTLDVSNPKQTTSKINIFNLDNLFGNDMKVLPVKANEKHCLVFTDINPVPDYFVESVSRLRQFPAQLFIGNFHQSTVQADQSA